MGPAIPLVAGMAINYFNNKNASDKAQNIEGGAAGTQQGYRTAALSDVNQQAKNIANSNPNTSVENGKFVAALRAGNTTGTNGPTSALGPVAGANKRFGSDVASGNAATSNYGGTQAGEMSAIDSAVTQRKNEALQMNALGTMLSGINQQAYQQNFVDQLRAKSAGTPNPWLSLVSKGLMTGAQGMAMNGAGANNPWAGTNWGAMDQPMSAGPIYNPQPVMPPIQQ